MTRPLFMRVKRPRDPLQDRIDEAMRPKLAKRLADAISARAASINEKRNRSRHGQASGVSDADVERILGVRR